MDQFDVEKLKEGAGTVLKEGKHAWNDINAFFNFNNPGAKLKSFVIALNKVNLVLTLIGFVVWFFVAIGNEIMFDAFWLYLVGNFGIVLGYALSYLSCLFLFAFAEMVENSTTLVSLKKSDKE